MGRKIILASKSKVRKEILDKNGLNCEVQPSNVDEDVVKESLEKQKASPEEVSKNLAELKANKVSQKFTEEFVIGADSVIDLNGKVISKPTDRDQAYEILKKEPQNFCVIGLTTEAERLVDIRKNRMNSLKETKSQDYTDLEKIKKEVQDAKELFKKYSWPSIDVTRKSVEETAASIIKIHEIYISKKNG